MTMKTWLGVLGVVCVAASTACGNGGTGGGGGGSATSVNNCDASTAEDHTADATTTVTFGGAVGTKYSPACIKVKKGNKVTFSGDFTTHPLSGGNTAGTTDASSPIAETKTGTTATFTFADAGSFGFFCEVHFSLGMEGAVFVE